MEKRQKFAVLMIHGIIGTPRHFTPFLPLIPEGVPRLNLLLDGHGKGVKEFSRTSMKIWKRQVTDAVDELLLQADRVLILAHSMGTLFAIEEAISRPEKIAGLMLLNPPMRVHFPLSTLLSSLKIAFGRVNEEDVALTAMRDSCGITLTRKLWQYIPWVPRYLELFAKIKAVRTLLPQLKKSAFAFHSRNDELVSPKALPVLLSQPRFLVTELPRSGHFYYEAEDLRLLQETFSKLLASCEEEFS